MAKEGTLPQVVLYTRARCHLCEEAKQQLAELQRKSPFNLTIFDIDQDPEKVRLYNDEVPVVFLHGRKAFKYRIEPDRFLELLRENRK